MFDSEHRHHRPPIGDLMDAVRRQQEVIRNQTEELEHLRTAAREAAEREAAEIIDAARADVRVIIADARRRLLELSATVQLAAGAPAGHDPSADESHQATSWQSEKRREMLEILREAKAEFDRLAEDAAGREQAKAVTRTDSTVNDFPKLMPTADPPDSAASVSETDIPLVEPPEPKLLFGGERSIPTLERDSNTNGGRSFGAKPVLIAFIGIGVAVVAGTAWWMHAQSAPHVQGPIAPPRATASTERPVTPPPADPPVRQTPASPPAGVSLRVEVQRPTWIRATVDGQAEAGAVQQPGSPREIKGDQEISLRVGDGGAVRVSFNGADATLLGPAGEPITKRFARPSATHAAASTPAIPAGSARGQGTGEGAGQTVKSTTVPSSPAAAPAARATMGTSAAATQGSQGSSDSSGIEASRAQLQAAAYRWLDAYYRGDPSAVAALGPGGKVSDQRAGNERMPGGLTVQRSFEGLTFQFAGETAILSARMMERAAVGGENRALGSWLSQTWLRESGEWRLIDVRLLGDTRVNAPR
jgi:hypothetical protein